MNCPLLPQRLRTGDDDAHRKTTASRSPPPPPCRAPPSASLCSSARALAFLTASACRPGLYPSLPSQRHTHFSFSPIQCHYTTILLRASTTPRHRCCLLLQSSPRSHCDSRPSARVPGGGARACSVIREAPRDGRGWRRRCRAEARRLHAAPRQGPAPWGLLLHHQPSPVA